MKLASASVVDPPGARPNSASVLRTGCVLAGLLLASSCGPTAGGPCTGHGFVCGGRSTAYECRPSGWAEIPCKGPAGCRENVEALFCDMSLDVAGDACPLWSEGQGICAAPDFQAVLECHFGVMVQTKTCSSCAVSQDVVDCTP